MAVVEVKFSRNIEFNSDQETEVSVKVEPVYGINENPEAENSRLMLSFTAGEEENKNNPDIFNNNEEAIGFATKDLNLEITRLEEGEEIPGPVINAEDKIVNLGDEFNINIQEENENGIVGTKVEVITKEVNAHRHLSDIYEIIDKSSLNEYVKENAKKIFMVIAEAEAKVHGTTIDKIHFHEVGAIDSIVDVVSACILVDLLCVDKIYATTVPVGSGFVKCDHGIMPVPAPATIEILKDVPIKLNTVKGECTTPTGAAIIKTLCDDFVDVLELEVKQIGYGIGHKKFEIPNILRTVLGVKKKKNLYMR